MAEDVVSTAAHASAPVDTVVGIGSSAGGLEALTELVAALRPGGTAGFLIAQHLSPDHPSLLIDLLGRATRIPVIAAVDGAELQPGEIVVGPPGCDISLVGTRLRVVAAPERIAPSPSIDVLFESIAEHCGARGVAVVLSGTGFDGSQGMRSVRARGGLAIAQSSGSARFDSMPRAAVALGGADLVLPAAEIGTRLATLGNGGAWEGEELPEPEPMALTTVAVRLKKTLGIDFSRYKESTLRRQVQRRMAIRQVATIEDYLPMLAAEPEEAHQLARHLLVTVTSFFRDSDSFAALAERLVSAVQARTSEDPLRVWVPGCATGEELYSIAMLCSEALGRPTPLDRHLKIFGTDLDEGSLAIARRGLYPLSAAERIPEELRVLYTHESPSGLEMSADLRNCAVFARHNVGENPPFPRMDLVSFRNTMIYFTVPLQDRVLELLRYSLVPGGLLFLGNSEALGASSVGFRALDLEHKIFEHVSSDRSPLSPSRSVSAMATFSTPLAPVRRVPASQPEAPDHHLALLEALVRSLARPCLVLDEHHDLVEVVGDVSPFCRVPEGRLLPSALAFLRQELQAEARALLLMAGTSDTPAVGRVLHFEAPARAVRLEARTLQVGARRLSALSFFDIDETRQAVDGELAPADRDSRLDREFERLERELGAAQSSLQQTVAELEAVNEELETSSEELQAASEELQASNEELEASNEELRATNEELVGVNQLLRVRADEQTALSTDLLNIQNASNQGLVIVDSDLRVTRFTPIAVRLFSMLDSDVGASLLSVPSSLPVPGLEAALRDVVAGGERCTLEASGPDQSYLINVVPYLDPEGRRRGAVITLTDVTELIRLRTIAETALADFTRVTNSLEEIVWKRDPTMAHLLYISDRVKDATGWSATELMQQPRLLDDAIVEEDRERVQVARSAAGDGWSVEYRAIVRDGRTRSFRESATTVAGGAEPMVVGTLSDISDRVAVQDEASDLSLVFGAVFDTKAFGIAVLDTDARVVMTNDSFCALVGYDRAAIVGRPIFSFGHADEQDLVEVCVGRLDPHHVDVASTTHHLVRSDGASVWVVLDIRRLSRPVGEAIAFAIVQDVTLLHDRTERLSRQARFDDSGTGLLNRAAFRGELGRSIAHADRSGASLALVWMDLDHFKEVNDQHGHAAGDDVLRVVAERLVAGTRTNDLVGRLGGDEFGMAISEFGSVAELEVVLARLLEDIAEPIAVADSVVCTNASFGVAFYPGDAQDIESLMRSADAAMYATKTDGGRSFSYFTAELNALADERRAMRAAISEAIALGQFELYFQPVVGVADGVLCKVEALLRWNRADRLVSAHEFISFAEESGQIREFGPLTFALLRADLEVLRAAGHGGLAVSLNLSVTQLEDRFLAEQLSIWPTASGLEGMVVEVVESVFLPGRGRAMAALRALEAHGARLSIDDFGSGFSNLGLLQSLSPSFVKLDRTFLDMPSDEARRSMLLHAAIDIAHSVGAAVVAEGIETTEQLELVRGLGVEYVQGYLIARPMPLTALIAWIEARDVVPPHG